MSRASERPNIPEDLRRFVLTSVSSVPFLEAILLLRGAPSVAWDTQTVAHRLYLGEPAAEALLTELVGSGIAAESSSANKPLYRYAPAAPLGVILDSLAHHYAIDLVGITSLIHSRVDKRALQFADAFRWKKDT